MMLKDSVILDGYLISTILAIALSVLRFRSQNTSYMKVLKSLEAPHIKETGFSTTDNIRPL